MVPQTLCLRCRRRSASHCFAGEKAISPKSPQPKLLRPPLRVHVTHIVYALAVKQSLCRYFGAEVYAILVQWTLIGFRVLVVGLTCGFGGLVVFGYGFGYGVEGSGFRIRGKGLGFGVYRGRIYRALKARVESL